MTAHTPGPWSVQWRGDFQPLIHQEGGEFTDVAEVVWVTPAREMDHDPAVANALLIAAAPDLHALVTLGQRMRAAQTAYFRNRTPANLQASKALEKDFDRIGLILMMRIRGEETATQQALIGDTDGTH